MTENKNSKPETVAWEFTAIVKTDKKEFEHKAGKLGKNPPEVPEKMSDEIKDKEPLIRRKDAEEYYGKGWDEKVWEYGYEVGREEKRREILKLIEEMMDIDQMNPEMIDEALKKQRLFALRQLKQKIEGW